jgi:hypothetical protein
MSSRPTTPSDGDLLSEAGLWLAGGGILTVALFPLSLPLLLLTVAAVLPFLVIPLVGALVAAVVAVPILLARRLWRWVSAYPRAAARMGPA